MRPALNFAHEKKLITTNPFQFLPKIKRDQKDMKYYNANELKELFDVLKGDEIELPVLVAAHYGFRRSELIGLKWNAIDFKNDRISVQHKVLVVKKIVHKSDKLKTKNRHNLKYFNIQLLHFISRLPSG